jgi:hypothetical protein
MNRWALFFVIGFVIGCGGAPAVMPPADGPKVTDEESFKERIQFIANTGGTGSATAGLVEMAEKQGNADLVADAKKLSKTQNPDDAKLIAKNMLEILNKPK